MHLCTNCQTVDWEKRIEDDLKLSKNGGKVKANCPYCTHVGGGRVRLLHSSHSLCDVCAKERGECQACGASTGDLAAKEAFEALFDAYVTLVKTYGATAARKILTDATLAKEEEPHVATLVALDVGEVDSAQPHQRYHYRLKRGIWTKVWGQLSFAGRPPRCARHGPPPRNAPAMVRAEKCGHWTAGHRAKWCLVCAVEHRQCADCETSTE
ncbi:MAG: hypothetical protein AAB554_02250 [Patescibacteria group bacterium]